MSNQTTFVTKYLGGIVAPMVGGLLALLAMIIASAGVGPLVERIFELPQVRGEVTTREEAIALLVQSSVLAVSFAALGFLGARAKKSSSLSTAIWFANPLTVGVGVYLYTLLRFQVPRAYFPAWALERQRLILVLLFVSFLASWLGAEISRRPASRRV
ncbi:MAG: hypothetical protein GZ088_04905 [Acidipila sp.]|nr:hypothetical protein [Acidipila sp.]